MKHLGDITKINGAEIEPVDVITGGSPCQDLSVAGKTTDGMRKGLSGERSGLFMEQIRVIKEMREHERAIGRTDEFIRPRFCIWENVAGSLSSPGGNRKGQDFAAVIEEFVKIVEPNCPAVQVPEGGWPKSGCFYDELGRWSIAWRLHNAEFWGTTLYTSEGVPIKHGTPQRRKRIALVADFGGLSAPEVLFERKGLRWNSEKESREGQAAATSFDGRIESTDSEDEE